VETDTLLNDIWHIIIDFFISRPHHTFKTAIYFAESHVNCKCANIASIIKFQEYYNYLPKLIICLLKTLSDCTNAML
jgi:hypothetical protein